MNGHDAFFPGEVSKGLKPQHVKAMESAIRRGSTRERKYAQEKLAARRQGKPTVWTNFNARHTGKQMGLFNADGSHHKWNLNLGSQTETPKAKRPVGMRGSLKGIEGRQGGKNLLRARMRNQGIGVGSQGRFRVIDGDGRLA